MDGAKKTLNILYIYVKQDVSFSKVKCTIVPFHSHVLAHTAPKMARR